MVLAAVMAALLTACGSAPSDPVATSGNAVASSGPTSTPTSTSSAAPRTPSATPTVPVADPSHAVPPPGPRTRRLASADLLVSSQHPLPATTVAAIRHAKGVTGVAQISLAQVSVEDTLLNVVAADPATYRLFEPEATADNQEIWDRVAGGELAVAASLQKKVPLDKTGFARLGSSANAPLIHVGAYVRGIPGLSAVVVNNSWGASLGIPSGNAVLVSTGTAAPGRVAKPLRAIVGREVSVQRLDVAAREGLDPGAVQTAVVVGSVADAVGHYTYRVLGGGRVAPDPAWVSAHIRTEQVPILGAVTCNKTLFPQLKAALAEVVARGLAKDIHTYNGCYNPRFIAGTTTLSNHAFGLAIDINTATNERGTRGTMNPQVVQIFESWGFTWGGTWHFTDPMHFEMNRLVHPG